MSALSSSQRFRRAAAPAASHSAKQPEPAPERGPAQPEQARQPEKKAEPEPAKPEGTLGEAVRARPYSVPQSRAKRDALDMRDKAIEEAAQYSELRPDALKQAQESKVAWKKAAGKLDEVKEAHQDWRQEHKISSWLHDKGLWKSGALSKHEDRERRHTSHTEKSLDKHERASEELERLDTHMSRAQDQARQGWSQLDEVAKQEQKQSQGTGGGSRGPEPAQKSERGYQNHEAITHTAGTAALAGGKREDDAPKASTKDDGMTGQLVEHGFAPYKNDPDNSESYFVKLKMDQGKEATHWGKDLGRAMSEADARPGDRVQLKRTGADQSVEVQENVRNERGQIVGTQETQAIRRGWSVNNLSVPQPAPEPMPESKPEPPKAAHRTLGAAAAARSPFADLDSPEASQPDPSLHPEVQGQKRRMRP